MKRISLIFGLITALILSGCEKLALEKSENLFLEDWSVVKTGISSDLIADILYFSTPADGFIFGKYGNILHTSDSGKTWISVNSELHSGNFSSAFFLNKNIGFVSTYSGLLKTSDAGNDWTKISYDTLANLVSMHFRDENNGLAIMKIEKRPNQTDALLVKTTNGGSDWIRMNISISESLDNKIICVDNCYYLIGTGNQLLKSEDFGESWQTISTPCKQSNDLSDLFFVNKELGFISDYVNAFKTEDGGKNWLQISDNLSHFECLHFINQSLGFNFKTLRVYDGGDFPTFKGTYMYCTADGGKTFNDSRFYKNFLLGLTSFPGSNIWYTLKKIDFNNYEVSRYTINK